MRPLSLIALESDHPGIRLAQIFSIIVIGRVGLRKKDEAHNESVRITGI